MARKIVEFETDSDIEYFDITNLSEEEFFLYYDAYEYNEKFGLRCKELKEVDINDRILSKVKLLTADSVIDFAERIVERDRRTINDLSSDIMAIRAMREKKED